MIIHDEHAELPGVIPENIPPALRRRPQWVAWRMETRDSEAKPTKVLYTPQTRRRASSTDLLTWSTFDEAHAAYEASGGFYDGIGFVFCSADPFVGIDLDKCIDPETGEIEGWAQEIVDRFPDFVLREISPSGTGVHLIVEGRCKDGVNTKSVEVYGQDRYFTVTGRTI